MSQTDNAVTWVPAATAPNVPAGSSRYFWVTVRRKSGKLHAFPAIYVNAVPLVALIGTDLEDTSGPGWSQVVLPENNAHDCDVAVTGWYDLKSETDYFNGYQPICEEGDEVLAWAEGPEPFDPASIRAPGSGNPGVSDTDRLNFLAMNPKGAQIVVDGVSRPCVFWGISSHPEATLREAIDLAMSQPMTENGSV